MFEDFKVPTELVPSDPRFASGPSLVPMKYVKSLYETGPTLLGTSHRKPGVKNLVKSVQEGIAEYFNIPKGYEVVVGNGGATFLWDMMGLGMCNEKSVHYTCGEFSTKWFKAHDKIPWIEAKNVKVEYGEGINPVEVDGYDMTCCTLNETSTGVQLSELTKTSDKSILAMDATSGAGQIACDLSKVDIFYFSPQKVFSSEGGTWFAVMSPKAIERVLNINESDRYFPVIMDWKLAIDNSRKNQTYNTPSISTLYYMNEQLKVMNKLGYDKICSMAEEKAKLIYGWAESKEYLNPYVKDSAFRSRAVATIDVDEKLPVDGLIKTLREQNAVYGIDAYRKLGRNQFRISMFHNILIEDLDKVTKILSLALEA